MTGLASGALPGAVEFTAEELRDAASMTPLEVNVLSARCESSRIRKVRSAQGWAFDTAVINGHVSARGAFEPGHVVVLAVMVPGAASICGVPFDVGTLLVIPDGEEILASMRPGVAYSAAVLPVALWTEILQSEAEESDARPGLIRVAQQAPGQVGGVAARLAASLRCFDAMRSPHCADEVPSPFMDFLGAVASAVAGLDGSRRRLDRSHRRRLNQAWLADDIIRARLDESLSVFGLCRDVGVSRRQLEYAFHTTFGVGPTEYIRLARLNESRRQLRSAKAENLTVTEVAMDVGVTHLGRFAESYRLLFGETPLQTLRACRR